METPVPNNASNAGDTDTRLNTILRPLGARTATLANTLKAHRAQWKQANGGRFAELARESTQLRIPSTAP